MILFTSERPLSRAENIKTVFDAYDGDKRFEQVSAYHTKPLGRYDVRVTDEFVDKADGEVVMIGHGIPCAKTYGIHQPHAYHTKRNAHLLTYVIGASIHTADKVARQSGVERSRVLPYGLPRTDALVHHQQKQTNRRLYLYAPTFRNRLELPYDEIDFDYIDSQLNDDERLVVKPHMLDGRSGPRKYRHIRFASKDEPTAPYLKDCDVLVTDFSSIMFDAMAAYRPVVLFAKHADRYMRQRGTEYEYPRAYSSYFADDEQTLVDLLRRATFIDEAAREFFCSACDGNATERVIKLLHKMER